MPWAGKSAAARGGLWGRCVFAIGVALLYFGAARVSLWLSYPDIRITAVWLPSGLALALALRHGWKAIPGIAIGDFAAGLAYGNPWTSSVAVALGGVAEALLGWWLLRPFMTSAGLLRGVRPATAFILLGAMVSPLASALLGVPALMADGIVQPGQLVRAAAVWWTGDAVGMLVVFPIVAAWLAPADATAGAAASAQGQRRGRIAVGVVVAVTLIGFLATGASSTGREAVPYAVYLAVVIGTLCMSVRQVAWTNLILGCITVSATVLGRGPFALTGGTTDIWLLQAYNIAVTATTLLIIAVQQDQRAALMRERRADLLAAARADMLATVSHEVRTPMNGVLGMLELLSRTPLAATQREMLQVARQSGARLLKLVNDALDSARLESGPVRIDAEPVALATLCEDIAEQMAVTARGKSIALSVDIDGTLAASHRSDGARIGQVLYNLCANAVKFTAAGEVRLVLRAEQPQDGFQRIALAVSDTGPGMAPEDLPVIFHPYARLRAGAAEEGVGLGLHICRKLADALGGEIDVRSTPGQGSTFTLSLRLPIVDAAPALPGLSGVRVAIEVPDPVLRTRVTALVMAHGGLVPDSESRQGPAAHERRPPADVDVVVRSAIEKAHDDAARASEVPVVTLVDSRVDESGWAVAVHVHPLRPSRFLVAVSEAMRREVRAVRADVPGVLPPVRVVRVLVADDDPVNREVVEAQLNALGHQAHCVPDGETALAAWRAAAYDLLLTDAMMPGLDGYGLARQIRQLEAEEDRTRMPIYLVTADASPAARRICDAAGMDGCLIKPLGLEALGDAIDAVFQGRRGTQGSDALAGVRA